MDMGVMIGAYLVALGVVSFAGVIVLGGMAENDSKASKDKTGTA